MLRTYYNRKKYLKYILTFTGLHDKIIRNAKQIERLFYISGIQICPKRMDGGRYR